MFISWMEDKEDFQDPCERLKSLLNDGRCKEVALSLFTEGENHDIQVQFNMDMQDEAMFSSNMHKKTCYHL